MGFLNAFRGLTKPAVAPQAASVQGGLGASGTMMPPATAPTAPSPLAGIMGGQGQVAQPLENVNVKTVTPPTGQRPFAGGQMGGTLGIANPTPAPAASNFMRAFGRRR